MATRLGCRKYVHKFLARCGALRRCCRGSLRRTEIMLDRRAVVRIAACLAIFVLLNSFVVPPRLIAQAQKSTIAEGGNEARGFDMAPETRLEVVEAAVAAIPEKLPPGPFKPS